MIRATSGPVRCTEAWKAAEEEVPGLLRPRPPCRMGRASISLSIEEQGGRPVSAGIKC